MSDTITDELRDAGQALADTRSMLDFVTRRCVVAAEQAAAAGMSDLAIAAGLGVSRTTARAWLGKDR